MAITSRHSLRQIKSPLNYIGGKAKILDQILPLFPKEIDNFIDLFAGGCNVGINVNANKVYFNDNLTYLIEMYQTFQENDLDTTILHIENRIKEFQLSLTNEEGYKKMREQYNKQKNPLDLFVLIAFSFNHQIRFNNNHEFNNPLLNLSLDDAAALMPSITLVFCLAWGIRAMLRLINSREKENDDV